MSKMRLAKNYFDKLTSNNSESWSLALFWIVVFEIIATLIEYSTIHLKPTYIYSLPNGIYTEVLIALILTVYLWLCVYNLIFTNKSSILYLILFGFIGVYLIITHDFAFDLFINNFNPIHIVQSEFGTNFIIQLFFKVVIFYLIFQLVKSLRVNRK